VTVTSDATAALDFSLAQSIIKLTEIVTTATGEQRRIELGHSVQTLDDIAQKVEQAAIKDIADLMVAKAPGVIVLPGSMSGAASNIKIRGIKSLSLSSDPIFVIDGIRMNSSPVSMSSGGTQASLLSSLNPEDISDIEIVKGPSAATLYGTDAANGVAQYALFGHTPANPTGLETPPTRHSLSSRSLARVPAPLRSSRTVES